MQVEVDQSGKIEWTQKPTVLAFANGKHFSIFLSAQAKRAILKEVANRRPNRSRTMHRLLVFATLLYILLKDHIDTINLVKVDIEYTGHEATIREHVLNLFRRRKRFVNPDKITFHRIGKKSPAHDLAIRVFRGKVPPNREITREEVLEEFRK